MNQTEYAKARGVNPAIFSAVQSGLIHLTAHGRVDVDQADGAWFRRHSEQREKRRGTVEAEARGEQAVTQATAAKLVMTRRKVDQLRDTTVERDRSQAEIGTAIADTKTGLGDALIEDPIRKAIAGTWVISKPLEHGAVCPCSAHFIADFLDRYCAVCLSPGSPDPFVLKQLPPHLAGAHEMRQQPKILRFVPDAPSDVRRMNAEALR
jgi:hypothetical protein